MRFCTDNAAMIAGLAHPLLLAGKTADLSLEAVATT
jgi:tRNA A37 threonylcarbamoyltransferase TsaD